MRFARLRRADRQRCFSDVGGFAGPQRDGPREPETDAAEGSETLKELTPLQCVLYAALIVLVTLIVTLVSLVFVPGDFGARLYGLANVAVVAAGLWLAVRQFRHGSK